MKNEFFYQPEHNELNVYRTNTIVFPLHLHNELELIYIEKGTLTVTIDKTIYELNQGDFAIVFPNVLHSYELTSHRSESILCICNHSLLGEYSYLVREQRPINPVIRKNELHPNIAYAYLE